MATLLSACGQTAASTASASAESSSAGGARLEEIARLIASSYGDAWGSWHKSRHLLNRRHEPRIPFPQPMAVTPLRDRSGELSGEPRCASGRDISAGGLSLVHLHPLPERFIAVSFALFDGQLVSMMVALRWCRFTRQREYHSGGYFVQRLQQPVCQPAEWSRLKPA